MVYIHCFLLAKPNSSRLFIGPFADEAAADAFRGRIERTRQSSSLLSSGYAMEIAPGIAEGWAAIRPEDFHGFSALDPASGQAVTVPLAK